MTAECEDDLTCIDMTCMDIPTVTVGDACTMDIECASINSVGGSQTGECRNMMCGFLPAALDSEACNFDFQCDEGLSC